MVFTALCAHLQHHHYRCSPRLSIFSDADRAFICMHTAALFGSLGLFRTTISLVSANRSCCTLSGTWQSFKKKEVSNRYAHTEEQKQGRQKWKRQETDKAGEAKTPLRKKNIEKHQKNGEEMRERGSMKGDREKEKGEAKRSQPSQQRWRLKTVKGYRTTKITERERTFCTVEIQLKYWRLWE